jgi:hypothetical protein
MSQRSRSGNANFTHIQCHGTPSAFTPGWIQQAGSVGPPGEPVVSIEDSINVNVCLDSVSGDTDYFVLGSVESGTKVTSLSTNAYQSVPVGLAIEVGYLQGLPGAKVVDLEPITGKGPIAFIASDLPEPVGDGLNGGQFADLLSVNGLTFVDAPSVSPGNKLYFYLAVTQTGGTYPPPTGSSINVKLGLVTL